MQPNSSLNKFIFWGVIIIVIINAVVLGNLFLRKGRVESGNISYTLALTAPIYAVSGTVKSVGSNNLVIEFLPIDLRSGQNKLTLKVNADKNTQIMRDQSPQPYIFVTTTPAPQIKAVTFADIHTGDTILVSTEEDIRRIKGSSLLAKSIAVYPESFFITGVVEKVEGTAVVIKGRKITALPSMNGSEEETFTVQTDAKTEIVSIPIDPNVTAPKPKKIILAGLKKDMPVTVFIGEAGISSLQALAIRTQEQTPLPPISSSEAVLKISPQP